MTDAQVAMHRDAGEEKNATVQVEVEQEAHQSTHEISKDPVVMHDITGY